MGGKKCSNVELVRSGSSIQINVNSSIISDSGRSFLILNGYYEVVGDCDSPLEALTVMQDLVDNYSEEARRVEAVSGCRVKCSHIRMEDLLTFLEGKGVSSLEGTRQEA